jgi:Na+-transporting methylmalonyl-CoA/oxaloacetate decarboxylase gamma subunit
MIKDSLRTIADSTRDALRGWRGLVLLSALYLALLACVYEFFSTGQATVWQLVVTGATALAPLLLFVLLAATVNFALPETETVGQLARRSLRDFAKVFLLALPVVGLGWLFYYLLGKLQESLPKMEEAPRAIISATAESRPAPLHWQEALMACLWIVLFGVVLPLLASHLWLSAARDGLLPTLKRIHRVAARAFAPRPALVYLVGFFVFALVPYFVLYTRTSVSNGWAEMTIFGMRLVFVFVLTLLGWTITLGALARTTPGDASAAEVAPAEPPRTEAPRAEELPPTAPPVSSTSV